MQNSELGLINAECKMQNPECKMGGGVGVDENRSAGGRSCSGFADMILADMFISGNDGIGFNEPWL